MLTALSSFVDIPNRGSSVGGCRNACYNLGFGAGLAGSDFRGSILSATRPKWTKREAAQDEVATKP
jgi:hypothetical protein